MELVPPLVSGRRPLVVGQVHRLLCQGYQARWTKSQHRVLLLVALSYQLAHRLLEDLALTPQPLPSRRLRWAPCPRSERILATRIIWSSVGSARTQPLLRTHAFMAELPEALVSQTLAWAPPVVQPVDRNGACAVFANHLSALLARQRLPNQLIRVRRLQYGSALQRTLPEICQGIVHVLAPLYAEHRRRIAELAPDERQALLLTGYSRATYFRLKGGTDAS